MAYFMRNKKKLEDKITYLPFKYKLKNEREVVLRSYSATKHENQVYYLFKIIVEEGNTYPQEFIESKEDFCSYFLSQNAFVCTTEDEKTVIGAFYIKQNFPDRSSHIANGGFIVDPEIRNCGVGRFMAQAFLFLAKDLGYEATFFNLVYETNLGAIQVYKSIGYEISGKIPKAGYLKGFSNPIAAFQFYYDLSKLNSDFLSCFN